MQFKREFKMNDQVVAIVVRPVMPGTPEGSLLHCIECHRPFEAYDKICIDRGNEVDGIILFHQNECATEEDNDD